MASRLFCRRIPFGENGQFGQFGSRDADSLKAFGNYAVGGGEKCDEQIHCRDVIAAIIARSALGIAQQANHIIGEELAIQQERGDGFGVLLVKKFAELIEQVRQIRA